jgi:hypothetical protein
MTMKIVSILYLFWHAFIVDDATFIVIHNFNLWYFNNNNNN